MDDKLNEDLNMMQTVSAICKAYPTQVSLVAQMGLHETTLNNKIAGIKTKALSTGLSFKGIYVVKSDSKTKLLDITFAGCAAIRSLADATNDQEMKINAKWRMYQLERLHKNDLITTSQTFFDIATALGVALEDHGFVAADLLEWGTSLAGFELAAEAPAVKREVHKSDLVDLKLMVADSLKWMTDTMDYTAIAYKRKDPGFFQLYTFGRQKHHQGHHSHTEGEDDDVINTGEYVLDVLRGGSIVLGGFPVLPGVTYLIENLKNTRLRFWAQATADIPTTIPTDAAAIEIAETLERTGDALGAPATPYLFFANESISEDGQVVINIVEL